MIIIYKFERLEENGILYGYYTKTKFSNGQTGVLFLGKETISKTWEWNVSFVINNKKNVFGNG